MQQFRTFIFVFMLLSLPVFSSAAEPIVSQTLLNSAGLETVWQSSLATEKNEKVQQVWLIGKGVYILTDLNYLFCLDRNTGKLIASIPLAKPGLPVLAPDVLDNTAYIIAGNIMVAIDTVSGVVLYRDPIEFVVTASQAVNSSYFYIPSIGNKLKVMDINDRHTRFQVSADDGSAITSVIADNYSAIFSTGGGSVVSMDTAVPKKIWQFNTIMAMAITAPIVRHKGGIYAAGTDSNVYKIDAASGKKIWEFRSGSALDNSPRVTDTVVYQFAVGKGLYAISAGSGKTIWLLPEGLDLLAQDKNISYVIDKTGACDVMDNSSGKKIKSINFLNVSKSVPNTMDSKIYIMDNKNRIVCIRPKQ